MIVKSIFNTQKSGKKFLIQEKPEFVKFVDDQFKQLVRRNLGLPMRMYHL